MDYKKLFSCLLIFVLAVSLIGNIVLADNPLPEGADEEPNGETDYAALWQESYDLIPDTNLIPNWPTGPHVHAHAAVVMDVESEGVLYAKNAHERMYPASITKYVTALIALENAELTDTIYITEASVNSVGWGYAHIGMQPGEEIPLEDALLALLLASANEVAYAIAESIGRQMGGGHDTFIQIMNERSRELGAVNSNWMNASGIHHDNHYTTAHDMAILASAFYRRPEYQDLLSVLEHQIPPMPELWEERNFGQNHWMMWEGNFHFSPYIDGGKTGFTDQSGTTLITTADNGELQLVTVLLRDWGIEAYNGTVALFDYAFSNFSRYSLLVYEQCEEIGSLLNEEAHIILPFTLSFEDVEREIEILHGNLAEVTYLHYGQVLGRVDVTLSAAYFQRIEAEEQAAREAAEAELAEEIEEAEPEIEDEGEEEIEEENEGIRRIIVLTILVILNLTLLILFFLHLRRKRKKALEKVEALRRSIENRRNMR